MRDESEILVWPQLLRLPSERVNVVYLDLDHWNRLSQASVGYSKGKFFCGYS